MSEISNDPRCKKIEQELDEYAEKTKIWQINRKKYVSQCYGNKFQFNDLYPYPYNDDNERLIINKIDEYMLSLSDQDKELANGHLLWKYKNYFSQPFAKHAIVLAEHAIVAYPLSDSDKIKFLEYLFKYNQETGSNILYKFDSRVLYKLANYNPNNNLEANNRLYNKALAFFNKPKRKNDEQIQIIYGMFKVFTQNVEKISPEAVVNYAKLYFEMADRTNKELDALILQRLLVKTPNSEKMAQMSGDYEVLDKKVVKEVFAAYVEHVYKHNEFNKPLSNQMKNLMKYLIGNNEYTLKEADALIDCLRPKTVDENGKKIRNNSKRTELQMIADELYTSIHLSVSRQKNPLRNVDIDDTEEKISNDKIVAYASFLFDEAKKNPHSDISIKNIYSLLTRGESVDKQLLLEVADIYGQSLTKRDIEQERYNASLHNKMTRMFSRIVTEYDYSSDEVEALRNHVEHGAGCHDEFVEMGRVIEANYAHQENWRFHHSPKKTSAPILHIDPHTK